MTLPDGTDTRPLLTQHLDSVQYLRAVAVVMIVLYAIGRALQRPGHGAAWLQRGIDIFCVLSGFVLWNSTVSRRMSTLAFFRRRLARVVPLYWFLTTATVVGLLLLDPTAMETGRVVPMHVLRSYLFVPTIHPLTRLVQPLLVPGWTLNEAMYVYFLFGLCLLLPMAARLPAIWLMLLATVALRHGPLHRNLFIEFYGRTITLEFGLGLLLGWASGRGWRVGRSAAAALLAVGCLALVMLPYHAPQVLLSGLPALAVVAGLLGLEQASRLSRLPALARVGDAAYSVYLIYPLALAAGVQLASHAHLRPSSRAASMLLATMMLAGVLLCGTAVHAWVEMPLRAIFRARGTHGTRRIAGTELPPV